MPDPMSHVPDMLASPAHVIRGLSYQIAYARDRVLQGDWSEKFARERIQLCAAVAEDNLRMSHGCKAVTIYANLTTGCRALFTWSFVDSNGEKDSGSVHPTMDGR
jgi:hypothetical protein